MQPSQRNLNVFFFFIYSVLGWVFEIAYCLMIDGEFVNRGYLHGPYCPIYGFGALLILNLIRPFARSAVTVFVTAVVTCTLLEYVTSWYMELVFGVQLWDYSSYLLNYEGRVCLWNSLLFGVLAVAVVYGFQPFVVRVLQKIPERARPVLAIGVVAVMLLDFFSVSFGFSFS